MNSPLISIILPTYNRIDSLKNAVQSVLDQTYGNWELIIVNDGSVDGTREWCNNLNERRIKYLEKLNQGRPSLARNYALPFIQGEWTAFLDSDDVWENSKLENQIKLIADNVHVGLVFTSVKINGIIKKHALAENSIINPYLLLLISNFITTSTVMVKSKLLKELNGFNPELIWAEDYDLWLKFAQKTKFLYCSLALVHYHISIDGLSKNRGAMTQAFENVGRDSMLKNKLNPILILVMNLIYSLRKLLLKK